MSVGFLSGHGWHEQFLIPMRGNEMSALQSKLDALVGFLIPMRGNEESVSQRATSKLRVFDPHEG